MSQDEMVQELKNFFDKIKITHRKISAMIPQQITNKELKEEINTLASIWFSRISVELVSFGLEEDVKNVYDGAIKAILTLSLKNSRRSSYEKQFQIIEKNFLVDLVVFVQTEVNTSNKEVSKFSEEASKLLEKLADNEENEYLSEALGCWEHDYLKAAVVLAWCAAIDRIHKVIEKKGFSVFNSTSSYMKVQTSGRYKRFTKEFTVHSINELQMVFDSDILWILEGMQLIDTNEKTRLSSCFDMRCHSGHPGAAPITKYNVLSCFSDIIEIVLVNPKFVI